MTAIIEQSQKSEVGEYVELFTLDLTDLGGPIFYWTPSRPTSSKPIVWNGNTYTSVDIQATGFTKSTSGTLPRPQLSVSNADNVIGAALIAYDDFLGCIITRTQTLYEYLDDQPGADTDQHWPVDVFKVERKVSCGKNQAVIELSCAIEAVGARLPKGVVARSYCPFIYRRWVSGAFDYTKATCPYTGASYFDRKGLSVAAAYFDSCGKRLTDCKARFETNAELPYGGFPGVGRN